MVMTKIEYFSLNVALQEIFLPKEFNVFVMQKI